MKKIGLIGGGHHSRHNHLPALQHYREAHPNAIELTAFCDINVDVAQEVKAQYGFASSYVDIAEMLDKEALDGVIAVTPVNVTKAVAELLIEADMPCVIEKPPGRDLEEARAICELVEQKQARVMVSVNRRFDPALIAAKNWLANREVAYFRASMLRHQRREPNFFSETGLHALDAMRWFMGDIKDFKAASTEVDGVQWRTVELEFANGTKGLLEVLPSCGMRDERYEFFGADFRVVATNGEMSTGEFITWESGKETTSGQPAEGQPAYVRNGALAETAEFIASLEENRPPSPSPAETVKSVEICCQIEQLSR